MFHNCFALKTSKLLPVRHEIPTVSEQASHGGTKDLFDGAPIPMAKSASDKELAIVKRAVDRLKQTKLTDYFGGGSIGMFIEGINVARNGDATLQNGGNATGMTIRA